MADAVTILTAVGSLITGLLGGGGIVKLLELRRQATQDIWLSYQRQIESAKARGDDREAERLNIEYEEKEAEWRHSRGRDATTLLLRGLALADEGHYAAALVNFDRAVKLRPRDPSVLVHRGEARYHLGLTEDAVADFDHVLDLKPKNLRVRVAALVNRGHAISGMADRSGLADRSGAVRNYDEALRLEPGTPWALYGRACNLALLGETEAALRDLKEAIRFDADEFIEKARDDPAFQGLFDDQGFLALLESSSQRSEEGPRNTFHD